MDINFILMLLQEKNILKKSAVKWNALSGGTISQVYLVEGPNLALVIKVNESNIVKQEVNYLSVYNHLDLLPKVIYHDSAHRFIVYSYIKGNVGVRDIKKSMLLELLVKNVVNHYQPLNNHTGWGFASDLSHSWSEFLKVRFDESLPYIQNHLANEDSKLIESLIKQSNRVINGQAPYLLHGDFGVHNFISHQGELTGVIDPTPVIGYPLYDLVYAFCSSPYELTEEVIINATTLLNVGVTNQRLLMEEVMIGLFYRIATCVKHHPEDLPQYLKWWEYWKKILFK